MGWWIGRLVDEAVQRPGIRLHEQLRKETLRNEKRVRVRGETQRIKIK